MRRLLFDSCILIDILKIDEDIIQMLTEANIPCFVQLQRQEIPTLEKSRSVRFLQFIPSSIEDVIYAKEHECKLSFYDLLFFRAALNSDFMGFTNDKRLLSLCKQNSIDIHWGLELFLLMRQEQIISSSQALEYAIENMSVNSRITGEHIEEFRRQLQQLS